MSGLFQSFHFDSKKPGPHVCIIAGVHGDEYEPVIAAERLVGCIGSKLIAGEVTIIPSVNVSACRMKSRCGEDGLDLARTCPGKVDGSITERVAHDLSAMIIKSDYLIDLHTGGKVFNIAPLAGYMLHQSEIILYKQRQMSSAFGLPVIWGTDRYAMGRTLSVARDAGVPAIYVEYGGPEPVSDVIINTYISGCLNVLATLSLINQAARSFQNEFFWVEDHRLNSGHLQSKMPAAVDGWFEPSIQAGVIIHRDDIIGKIKIEDSSRQIEIRASEDGLVLLTRVGGRVKKDESLGGILPLTKPGKIVINE